MEENLIENLKNFFTQSIHLKHAKKIAVAVSGGSDSMSLLFLLHEAVGKDTKIAALTVDHNLRSESKLEANYVKQICKENNIEHHILHWEYKQKPEKNIMEEARLSRYNLLSKKCINIGVKYLFTAHHAEDNIENFFIRLERGSGINGLSSIPTSSYFGDVVILRPLLNIGKETLRNFLLSRRIAYVTDASNENPVFTRVRYRQAISIAEPLYLSRIHDTIKSITRARTCLDKQIFMFIKENIILHDDFRIEIDSHSLLMLDEEIIYRVIERVLLAVNYNKHRSRFKILEKIVANIKENNKKLMNFFGVYIKIKGNIIIFYREDKRISEEIMITEDSISYTWDKKWVIFINKTAIKENMLIRKLDGNEKYSKALPSIWIDQQCVWTPNMQEFEGISYEYLGKKALISNFNVEY